MSLNILLGYFIILKQQLGCVRNVVALNKNLGARLAVGGGVVAGAHGEVHLALVRELRGVNLGQGGLLRLQTDHEEVLPDTCPDYLTESPSCCRTWWPHSALCSPTSPCTPAPQSFVTSMFNSPRIDRNEVSDLSWFKKFHPNSIRRNYLKGRAGWLA